MFVVLTFEAILNIMIEMIPPLYQIPSRRYREEVGLLIKKAREKKAIPQGRLASRIGLTRTSINNIEHGRQRLMLDTLLMISDILNMPIADLLPKNFEILPSIDNEISKEQSEPVKAFIDDIRGTK